MTSYDVFLEVHAVLLQLRMKSDFQFTVYKEAAHIHKPFKSFAGPTAGCFFSSNSVTTQQ